MVLRNKGSFIAKGLGIEDLGIRAGQGIPPPPPKRWQVTLLRCPCMHMTLIAQALNPEPSTLNLKP